MRPITFAQSGTGNLVILGNAANYTGTTTTSAGSLSIAQFGNSAGTGSLGSGAINIGVTGTSGVINYLGLGGGAAYGGTGAGETTTTAYRAINIANTTVNGVLFANQFGTAASALSLQLTTSGAGSQDLLSGWREHAR